MSRKIKIISVLLCALVFAGCIAGAASYRKAAEKTASVLYQSGRDMSDIFSAKYAKKEELTKAKKAVNAVWISANGGKTSPADAGEAFFDTVFIDCTGADTEKITTCVDALSKKEKASVLSLSASAGEDRVSKLSDIQGINGIILTGFDEGKKNAGKIKALYAAIKQKNPSVTVYADIPYKTEGSYDYKSMCDTLYVEIPRDVERKSPVIGDYGKYTYEQCVQKDVFEAWCALWNARSKKAGLPLFIGYSNTERADTLVLQALLSDGCPSLKGRVYRDFEKLTGDNTGAFDAVQAYITSGINTKAAFRILSFSEYNGETAAATSSDGKIALKCSTLFPLYVNGQKTELPSTELYTLSVGLHAGKNEIKISQNNTEIIYYADYQPVLSGSLITFVIPDGEISVRGGSAIDVTVGAHILSDISATFCGQTIQLKKNSDDYGDYATFSGSFIMPKAADEAQHLGKIYFTASAQGTEDETYQGADVTVLASGDSADIQQQEEQERTAPVTLKSDNNTGNDAAASVKPGIAVTEAPKGSNYYGTPTTAPSGVQAEKTAISKVCMIKSASAETRPVSPLSNTYVPTYNTLPYGTLDTVIDTAQCTEKGETNEYYVLQSGRMVQAEDCSILDGCVLNDNTLTVNSCTADTDGITLNISSTWRVPYTVSIQPQSYKSGYEGKQFNISSFTANRMDITFFYTPQATDSSNICSNDIISYSSLNADPSSRLTTLSFFFKTTGKFYGYSIGYNNDGTMYIKISDNVKLLSGSVILLDPGHGGSDAGALGMNGSIYESNVNLQIAAMTAQKLIQSGATVYMTRNDNSNISLEERKLQTDYLKPDVFVSIHCNASSSSSSHGTAAYYYQPWSKALASCINTRLVNTFDTRLSPGNSSGLGTSFYPFSVCRTTCCPAVLIETAFITNADDCYALASLEGEDAVAQAICDGISDYLFSQA
ncbi:MAG: N-acetylmuramoyl-L-alanine amidase [Clostridia bacterium]|nr:N-acetylmuramoyl-L-alanine amidase [Clostridia bacterium]